MHVLYPTPSYLLKYSSEAAAEKEEVLKGPMSSISARLEDDADDTIASRFVVRLLNWLLEGFLAKNKVVRYRCVCIVSEMISHLGEIEQVIFFLCSIELIRSAVKKLITFLRKV